MQTLQEFVRFTKGWEYLIAIMAIFAWLVFWTLFKGRGSGDENEAAKQASPKGQSSHQQ